MKITKDEKKAFQKAVKYYRELANDLRKIKNTSDYQKHSRNMHELESAGILNINNGTGVYVLTF